ncbi:hypothetical protein CB1_001581016 [Camelus ferus]|nr:hypothetical protein CB1_001581016 [Camelus ferus]
MEPRLRMWGLFIVLMVPGCVTGYYVALKHDPRFCDLVAVVNCKAETPLTAALSPVPGTLSAGRFRVAANSKAPECGCPGGGDQKVTREGGSETPPSTQLPRKPGQDPPSFPFTGPTPRVKPRYPEGPARTFSEGVCLQDPPNIRNATFKILRYEVGTTLNCDCEKGFRRTSSRRPYMLCTGNSNHSFWENRCQCDRICDEDPPLSTEAPPGSETSRPLTTQRTDFEEHTDMAATMTSFILTTEYQIAATAYGRRASRRRGPEERRRVGRLRPGGDLAPTPASSELGNPESARGGGSPEPALPGAAGRTKSAKAGRVREEAAKSSSACEELGGTPWCGGAVAHTVIHSVSTGAPRGITCPTPTSVEHANIRVKSYNLNSRERYVCNSGFKRKAGTSSLTECVFNKTMNITHWTTPNLKCIRDPSLTHQRPPPMTTPAGVTPGPESHISSGKGEDPVSMEGEQHSCAAITDGLGQPLASWGQGRKGPEHKARRPPSRDELVTQIRSPEGDVLAVRVRETNAPPGPHRSIGEDKDGDNVNGDRLRGWPWQERNVLSAQMQTGPSHATWGTTGNTAVSVLVAVLGAVCVGLLLVCYRRSRPIGRTEYGLDEHDGTTEPHRQRFRHHTAVKLPVSEFSTLLWFLPSFQT